MRDKTSLGWIVHVKEAGIGISYTATSESLYKKVLLTYILSTAL